METQANHILVVEGSVKEMRRIERLLEEKKEGAFAVESASRLRSALGRLERGGLDALLLNLNLPDSKGLETFTRLHAEAPAVAPVVLVRDEDEALAREAIRAGAQDYLLTSSLNGEMLARSLRNAIERHRLRTNYYQLAVTDALTGLSNRRAFLALAEHQLRASRRRHRGFVLMFLDLDGMKRVNDTLGHREGDRALVLAARALRATFRDSDIVARVGGDEFVVLAVDAAEETSGLMLQRLEENMKRFLMREMERCPVAYSVGVVHAKAEGQETLDGLLDRADEAMYREKRAKPHFHALALEAAAMRA